MTTASASWASVGGPARCRTPGRGAASFAGTSHTCSPSASRRCAIGRPAPFATSIAQTRSGHCCRASPESPRCSSGTRRWRGAPPACSEDGQTLFRAERTLLEPRLAAVPGRAACQTRATPRSSRGWAADERAVRPSTNPRLTGQPAPGSKTAEERASLTLPASHVCRSRQVASSSIRPAMSAGCASRGHQPDLFGSGSRAGLVGVGADAPCLAPVVARAERG